MTTQALDQKINALFREKEAHEKIHGLGTWPMEKLLVLKGLTTERVKQCIVKEGK